MKNKGINNKFKKLLLTILTVLMLFNFVTPNYSHATFGAGTATHIIQIVFDALQHLIIHAAIPMVVNDGNGITAIDVMGDNGTEVSSIEEIANITKRQLTGTATKQEYKDAYYTTNEPASYSGIEINQNATELGKFGIPRYIVGPLEMFAGKIPILDANYFKDTTGEIEAKSLMRESIRSWYNTFRIVAILGLLCVLIYLGIRIIISASVTDKVKYKHMLVDWVVALCLIFCLHYIMSFTMNMVDYLVETIGGMSDEEYNAKGGGEYVIKITHMAGGPRYAPVNLTGYLRVLSTMNEGDNINELMYAIAYGIVTVLTLVFLFTYYKRLFTLTFLTFIAPLVALTYPLDKIKDGKAQAFNYWLREYITNAMLPVIHIILYKVLISTVPNLVTQAPLYAIFALAFMIPAEKIVKSMFGVRGETAPPPSIAGATLAGNMIGKAANEAGSFLGGSGKKAAKLTADTGGSAPKPSKGGDNIFKDAGEMLGLGTTPPGVHTTVPQRNTNPQITGGGGNVQGSNPIVTLPNGQQVQTRIGGPGTQTQMPNSGGENNGNIGSNPLQSLKNNEIDRLNRLRAKEYYDKLDNNQKDIIKGYIPESVRDNPTMEHIEAAMKRHDEVHDRAKILGSDDTIENKYNAKKDAIRNGSADYVRAAHYYEGMSDEDKNRYLSGVVKPGDSNFESGNSQQFIDGITGENGYLANNQGIENPDFEAQVTEARNVPTEDNVNTDLLDDMEMEDPVLGLEPINTDIVETPEWSIKNLKRLGARRFNIPAGSKGEIALNLGGRAAESIAKKGVKGLMMYLGTLTGAGMGIIMAAGSGKDPGDILSSAVTGSMTGLATGKSIGNGATGVIDRGGERLKDDFAYWKHGEDFEKEREKKAWLQNRSNYYEIEKRVRAENRDKGWNTAKGYSENKDAIRKATYAKMKEYAEYNDALGGNASMKELHRMDDIKRDIYAEEREAALTANSANGNNSLSEAQEKQCRKNAMKHAKEIAQFKTAGGYTSSTLLSKKGSADATEAIRNGYRSSGRFNNEQLESATRKTRGRLDYLVGKNDKIYRNGVY